MCSQQCRSGNKTSQLTEEGGRERERLGATCIIIPSIHRPATANLNLDASDLKPHISSLRAFNMPHQLPSTPFSKPYSTYLPLSVHHPCRVRRGRRQGPGHTQLDAPFSDALLTKESPRLNDQQDAAITSLTASTRLPCTSPLFWTACVVVCLGIMRCSWERPGLFLLRHM